MKSLLLFLGNTDHSSLKHSYNPHASLKSSENTAKRSTTHQCITLSIFIFIAFFNKIQWPIKISAFHTLTYHSKQVRNEKGEGTPTPNLSHGPHQTMPRPLEHLFNYKLFKFLPYHHPNIFFGSTNLKVN